MSDHPYPHANLSVLMDHLQIVYTLEDNFPEKKEEIAHIKEDFISRYCGFVSLTALKRNKDHFYKLKELSPRAKKFYGEIIKEFKFIKSDIDKLCDKIINETPDKREQIKKINQEYYKLNMLKDIESEIRHKKRLDLCDNKSEIIKSIIEEENLIELVSWEQCNKSTIVITHDERLCNLFDEMFDFHTLVKIKRKNYTAHISCINFNTVRISMLQDNEDEEYTNNILIKEFNINIIMKGGI